MKRLVCLVAAVVLLLTSCSSHGVGVYDPYHGKLDDIFFGVTAAINDQEGEAIKALFAESVLQQDTDFDEDLEQLLGFVQGKILSSESKGHSGGTSADNGEKVTREQSWYVVNTEQERYIFIIIACLEDTTDPDNIGVETLRVLREADKDQYFASWEDVKTPGIYVGQVSIPDGSEVVIYTDEQLEEIANCTMPKNEHLQLYPTPYIKEYDGETHCFYYSEASVVNAVFDSENNRHKGIRDSHIKKISPPKEIFENIKKGDSLKTVEELDPNGYYDMVYYSGSQTNYVSMHYTADKYIVWIYYDADILVKEVTIQSMLTA